MARRWTAEETALLIGVTGWGKLKAVARKLDRTYSAVKARACYIRNKRGTK